MTMNPLQKRVALSLALICGSTLSLAGFLFSNDIFSAVNTQTENLRADLLQITQEKAANEKAELMNFIPRKINNEIHLAAQAAIFPAKFDRTNLLTILESISLQSQVGVDEILFGDEIDQTDFRILPFAMEVTGTHNQIFAFLSELTQKTQTSHRPIFNVTDMTLTQPDLPEVTLLTQGENAKWHLSLQLETFAQIPD